MSEHPYAGRKVALATKHAKQEAIAPAFASAVGMAVTVPPGLDTDQLGTFTGEIERPAPPRETTLMKARLGIQASGLPLALASEGAFGPHPQMVFAPAGYEVLALVDEELGIEVVEQRISTTTNFAHKRTTALDRETEQFLASASFPSHAIVVRPNAGDPTLSLHKGVTDVAELHQAIRECVQVSQDGLARLETDMRAHQNPTRMGEIALLAEKLAARVVQLCPACGAPGHGLIDVERGLPCEWCCSPTELVRHTIYGCSRCAERERRERGDGLQHAEPGQCHRCNP